MEKTKSIINKLKYNIRVYSDFSCTSIGKRYVRSDEIGILYIVTVDFQTLEDDTVTVRSRDSMEQKRINISKILEYVKIRE
jgi:glycyl-tRNA synthetase